VTPEELQRVIERTGTKYVNAFTSLYASINADLAELYQTRLAERDLAVRCENLVRHGRVQLRFAP